MLGRKHSFERIDCSQVTFEDDCANVENPTSVDPAPCPAVALTRSASAVLRSSLSVCMASSCCFCIPVRFAHRIIVVCDVLWMVVAILGIVEELIRTHSVSVAPVFMMLCKMVVARYGVLSVIARTPDQKLNFRMRHLQTWVVRFIALVLITILTASLGTKRIGTQIRVEVVTCQTTNGRQSGIQGTCNGSLNTMTVVMLMIFSPFVTDSVFFLLPGLLLQIHFIAVLRSFFVNSRDTSRSTPHPIVIGPSVIRPFPLPLPAHTQTPAI
eukprot:c10679_g1_i6.p1 GENE.c10679_g1_i6~~c10679_g1_i6.p1  ORF type:complete len:269 (-),score=21.33 c10679_g1_i6:94-900(-)